jgi:hypothetical protein
LVGATGTEFEENEEMSFNKIIAAGLAALGLAVTGSAGAQGGYGALSAFDWEIQQGDSPKIESTGIRATGGYMFNDAFGFEGHVGVGGTDDIEYPGGMNAPEDAEAELNKLLGVFAKVNLPLPLALVDANVFGLAGYSVGKVEVLAETTTDTFYENSFSYGVGADVALIPDRLYLTADYIDYISRTGTEASAASVGLRLSFSGN